MRALFARLVLSSWRKSFPLTGINSVMAEVAHGRLSRGAGFAMLRSDETGPHFATALARLILHGDPFSFSLPIDQLYRLRELVFLAPLYERWQKFGLERDFRSRLGGLPVGQRLREEVVVQDADHHFISVTVELSQDRSAGDGSFTVRFDFPRAVRHAGLAQWSEAHARDWVEMHPGGSVVTIREGSRREGVVQEDFSSEQRQAVTYVLNFFADMVRRVLTDKNLPPVARARLNGMEREALDPFFVSLDSPEFDALAYWAQPHVGTEKGTITVNTIPVSAIFPEVSVAEDIEVMGILDRVQSRLLVCIPNLHPATEISGTNEEVPPLGGAIPSYRPSAREIVEDIVGITFLVVRLGMPALREWISSLVPWGRHRPLKKG
jgi:hypothetical protein